MSKFLCCFNWKVYAGLGAVAVGGQTAAQIRGQLPSRRGRRPNPSRRQPTVQAFGDEFIAAVATSDPPKEGLLRSLKRAMWRRGQ